MPSVNQSNTQGTTFKSEEAKMLHKPDGVLAGIIRGLRTPEDVTAFIEAEIDGQCRQNVIAALNKRKLELENEGG